ncbi:MAG: prohibitin family protein [Candidatus Moraniibacteriota bacterium]
MLNPNKSINSKYLAPAIIFIAVGLPIIFSMFGYGGFLILIVIAVVLFRKKISKNETFLSFINNLFNKNNMVNQAPDLSDLGRKASWFWRIGKIGLLLIVVIWIFFRFVIVIDAGETGVYSLFGKVNDEELRSGIHLVNPLAKITLMNIRTEQYTMSIASAEGQRKGDDSILSLTKEGLDVSIDFTALYRLEESKASDIYREVGLDYVEKIIRPEIRGIIRDVVSQYDAKELYSEKRQEASSKIFSNLKEKVESRGIIIEEAVIRNVQLPQSLAKAIQEKLASEQEAQRYDFVLEKERKEADRKRIEAEGQRDAQKIINESLSSEYLNYLYIKELKDRQGTIYVPVNPSSGMPLFKGIGE